MTVKKINTKPTTSTPVLREKCFWKMPITEYDGKSLSHCWKFCNFLATSEVRCQTQLTDNEVSKKSCHRATRSAAALLLSFLPSALTGAACGSLLLCNWTAATSMSLCLGVFPKSYSITFSSLISPPKDLFMQIAEVCYKCSCMPKFASFFHSVNICKNTLLFSLTNSFYSLPYRLSYRAPSQKTSISI